MKTNQNLIILAIVLFINPLGWANNDLPSWFDKQARLNEISKLANNNVFIKKYHTASTTYGKSTLTSVLTQYEPENGKGDGYYFITEFFIEPPKTPKRILKWVHKTDDCNARKLKETAFEEIGAIKDQNLIKIQLILEPPSCEDSAPSRPEILLIALNRKSGLDIVYESEILKNGHQVVKMEKNNLQIELTADKPTFINLTWNGKKFVPKK